MAVEPGPPAVERLTADLPLRIAEARPRVLVVGDVILDGWLSGECRRLCREAPAPVLEVNRRRFAPGGAGNTAANLAGLGADTVLVSAVGDDREGGLVRDLLRAAGVNVAGVLAVPGRRTVTKRRLVAGQQLLARLDEGDDRPVPATTAAALREALAGLAAGCDALLVCDYGLGVLDDSMVAALRRLRPRPPVFAVDAHDVGRWAGLRPDFVTPNAEEAWRALGAALPGDPETRLAVLPERQADLHEATGADSVVVTLDRAGSILLRRGQPTHRTWADPVPDSQTTGAGDTYVAAVCVARSVGLPMTIAVELGQAAADVVVHQGGTATCDSRQLAERLGQYRMAVLPAARLAEQVREHRAAGRRIIFTNGCFDLLHPGHVGYLNQAKRLGDVLIVGVNSDASVRRLKGPGRPVNTATDRAAVLAALSCVDHVTIFDEDDAGELLRLLQPEVYTKGGDYTPEMLPETAIVRAYGGTVQTLDYLPDQSTSSVIERITASTARR